MHELPFFVILHHFAVEIPTAKLSALFVGYASETEYKRQTALGLTLGNGGTPTPFALNIENCDVSAINESAVWELAMETPFIEDFLIDKNNNLTRKLKNLAGNFGVEKENMENFKFNDGNHDWTGETSEDGTILCNRLDGTTAEPDDGKPHKLIFENMDEFYEYFGKVEIEKV